MTEEKSPPPKIRTTYVAPARFNPEHVTTWGNPNDDSHAKWQYRISKELDHDKLVALLNDMLEAGANRAVCQSIYDQYSLLRNQVFAENNRVHNY